MKYLSLLLIVLLTAACNPSTSNSEPSEEEHKAEITKENNNTKNTIANNQPRLIVGERCEVKHREKWYSGIIKEVHEDGTVTVHRDGYAANNNLRVDANQLKEMKEIPGVIYLKVPKDKKELQASGNIKFGKTIDLKWAQNSSVACFPGTRFVEFQGKQQFYWIDLPSYSTINIELVAENNDRINLYAFSGFDGTHIPPNLPSCVSCEAAYEQWNPTKPPKDFSKAASKQQSVELRATKNPYRVFIAVAGAKGVESGKYKLNIRYQ